MADPLSIAAGVVGIVVPALHGARLLVEDIQKILDAPDTIRLLQTELVSLTLILQSLRAIEEAEWQGLGSEVAEQFGHTLRVSGQTCERFRTDLRRWTRDAKDGKLSWKSRATVGLFRERQIKAMTEQVQSCKLNCSCVIGMGNLYATLRARKPAEDVKSAVQVTVQAISQSIAHDGAPPVREFPSNTSTLADEYSYSPEMQVRRPRDPLDSLPVRLDPPGPSGLSNSTTSGRQRPAYPRYHISEPVPVRSSLQRSRSDDLDRSHYDERERERQGLQRLNRLNEHTRTDDEIDEIEDRQSFSMQAATLRSSSQSSRTLLSILQERMLPDELTVFANSVSSPDESAQAVAQLDMQELLLLAEVAEPVEVHEVVPIEDTNHVLLN